MTQLGKSVKVKNDQLKAKIPLARRELPAAADCRRKVMFSTAVAAARGTKEAIFPY